MKITAIKQQVKRKDRYSIYVDGVYAFSLSESALLNEGIASGKEIDAASLKSLKEASGADKAYGNALRYVAIRLRSEWEVRTYLERKQVDEPVISNILDRLRHFDLLNDEVFARAWIDNRLLLKSVSRRRLQLELRQKHVRQDIIDAALSSSRIDERQSLQELALKKRSKYPDKNKLMQYLARQGFGYDDISSVLGQLEDDQGS